MKNIDTTGSDLLKSLKGKKVLVFGLGLLGGGVATTNWLLKHGAKVTVTDAKSEELLKPSIKRIKGKVVFKLGHHHREDIDDHDLIVINPSVPVHHELIQYAIQRKKDVVNEGTIFYNLCPKPIVSITGTRGKTTTVTWTNYFLSQYKKSAIAGNSPTNQFLKMLDKASRLDVVVTEIPSFHLELFHLVHRGPDVAVITNIYPDHLNRHGTMEGYAGAKANLFKKQTKDQHLILNQDNEWTLFFLAQKPKAKLWFFSAQKPLPEKLSGVFYDNKALYFQVSGHAEKVCDLKDFVAEYGQHNLENLLASSLAAYLAGISWLQIQKCFTSLPSVEFRQEVIFKNKKLTIINDTTAASPEGGIAALKRFAGPHTVMIAGGTDANLDFSQWANILTETIKPENTILLDGSATQKMLGILGRKGKGIHVYDSLERCVSAALAKARKYPKSMVVFSPAAKSFEKFKNEYDRGEQFNKLVKKEVR